MRRRKKMKGREINNERMRGEKKERGRKLMRWRINVKEEKR